MAYNTTIEWTDATWNPVTGCTKVGAGCDNCYAETLAERFRGKDGHYFENGFDLQLRPKMLEKPLSWKKPRRIFVNSMSDLFHKDIPREYIDKVYAVMREADWHTYQVLTKRSSLMAHYIYNNPQPEHIWHGVSVENELVKNRISHIRHLPGIKFVSFEPLLGMVQPNLFDIHWVIVGGESGHGARPMHPEWVKDIYGACRKSQTSFFFKQWGEYDADGTRVGKKKAGRKWAGSEWNNMPNRWSMLGGF